MNIIVLGGGVIGVTTAYFLSAAGHEITVVERREGPGLETSFANGGQISVSHAAPWSRPELPGQLIRWMGRRDAPFRMIPQPDPHMWRWGISFLRNCNSARFHRNAVRLQRLAAYSQKMLTQVRETTDIEFHHAARGILSVFRTIEAYEAAAEHADALRGEGVNKEVLDTRECLRREPALQDTAQRITGGIFSPLDECGDAHIFTQELAKHCARGAVTFRYNEQIMSIDTNGDTATSVTTGNDRLEADAIVVAMGSESPLVTRPLGIPLPVYPVKGYSVTIPIEGRNGAPSMGIADEERKIVVARLGDKLRAAGTAELVGYDRRIDERRARSVLKPLLELFPNGGDAEQVTFWTGLRPMTPDGSPVIGPTRVRNLYLNAGHGSVGWTLACGSARLVSDMISGEPSEIDPSEWALARYH